MLPSNNLFALVRAYDLEASPAKEKEVFISQGKQFLCDIEPYAEAIAPLFAGSGRKSSLAQFHYDAMLSVAYDIGLELFFDSRLPALIHGSHSKKAIRDAFLSLPVCYGVLRPELEEQMLSYRIKPMSRRAIEMFLFLGQPYFTIGRCRNPTYSDEIVYSVSLLHPFYQFLYRHY